MAITCGQSDIHWKAIQFLQDAGAVYNLIHAFDVRSWGVKYSIWLRDRNLHQTTYAAPVFEGPIEAKTTVDTLRDQLNAIAVKHFAATTKYDYDGGQDGGPLCCAICDGPLFFLPFSNLWLKCEECDTEFNVETSEVVRMEQ